MEFKIKPRKLRELLDKGAIKLEVDKRADTKLMADEILDAFGEISDLAANYDRDYDRGQTAYDRFFDRTTGGP